MRQTRVILSYFPLFLIGLYTTYVFSVYAHLGELPKPYINPDPKVLGFDIHHDAIWLITMFLAPPLILGWFIIGLRYQVQKIHIFAFILSLVILFILYYAYPEVVNWFMD